MNNHYVELDGTVDVDPDQLYQVLTSDGNETMHLGKDLAGMMGSVYVRIPEAKALTETVASGVSQIPYSGLEAIGSVFVEGLKYGKDNWKKGVNDKGYQEQRCEHAIRHLQLWANGDRQENHLAKVAWFCVAQIELERLENE